MKQSTRMGLLGGFASMFLITMLYVSDPHLLVVGYAQYSLLILFAFMLVAVLKERKTSFTPASIEELAAHDKELSSKDFAAFSELLRIAFRVYFIGYLIKFVFIYILFNFIDVSLVELVRDAQVQVFLDMRDESITDAIFQTQLEQFKAQDFSPGLDVLGIFLEMIIGFVMALGLAFFLRRDAPDY
jgi:hypothetical protein